MNRIINITFLTNRSFSQFSTNQNQYRLMYKNILEVYQKSMKKPTEFVQQNEIKMLNNIIAHSNFDKQKENEEKVEFIAELRHFKFFTKEGLQMLDIFLRDCYSSLGDRHQRYAKCFLAEQRREKISETKNKNNKIDGIDFVLDVYSNCVFEQKIEKIEKIEHKNIEKLIEKFKEWHKEIGIIEKMSLINSENDILKATENKIHKLRSRSNLEIEIEALLSTLELNFEREVNILGFTVDFVVKLPSSNKKIVLEVLGNHHYTVTEEVFGRDLLRKLIIESQMPIAFIHAADLNLVRGTQNRLNFIEEILKK